jgi:membrane protease subunit (stomatin/prohibitin family)
MYREFVKNIKSTNKQATNKDINDIFISNLQKELDDVYNNINLDSIAKENSFFVNTFKKTIAKNLIDNLKKDEKYLFVSPSGKVKVIQNNDDLKNAIDKNEIKITALSDAIPRLTFDSSVQE